MPIDPAFRALLELPGAELRRPPPELGAAGLRAALAANPLPPVEKEAVHEVRELTVRGAADTLRVRLYRPSAATELPLVVFFHGGGFVMCDLETHDPLCRSLARASNCAVASVEYRLAPEARFPGPLEDCYAAVEQLAARASELGADPARLAVCGDSAGGNLATVTAMLARDRGGPRLSYQALIYPVTDLACESASVSELSQGYMLTADIMRWFSECYLGDLARAADPLASPLRATNLAGLPPATVITAECDPLRDEGEAYGDRLRQNGVPVVGRRYLGMLHGFMSMPYVTPVAGRAIADLGLDLRAALGPAR
ncbi:MAG: alpha/beta hydrolase [Steroidobacteraceae bacterium]|jgi:acetyl esterase|nr:alpha/beta hydrolase [Steroidobacteraceae bacterium]